MKKYDLLKQLVIFILLSGVYMGTWNIFIVQELGVGQKNWNFLVWFLPGIITMSLLRYALPGWYKFIRGIDIFWYTSLEILILLAIWMWG